MSGIFGFFQILYILKSVSIYLKTMKRKGKKVINLGYDNIYINKYLINKDKKLIVIMKDKAENEYEQMGLEEFSIN